MSAEFTTSESIADLIAIEQSTQPISESRRNLIARLQESFMWAVRCEDEERHGGITHKHTTVAEDILRTLLEDNPK